MEITRIDTGKTFPGEQEVLWYSKDDIVYLEPSEEELAEMAGLTLEEYRANQEAENAHNVLMLLEFAGDPNPEALDYWKHS